MMPSVAKLGPNLWINPRVEHWQKGPAMPAPAAVGGYQCDFWGHRGSGSTIFVEQKTFPLGSTPLGLVQRRYLRATVNSVAGPGNFALMAVDIDGVHNFAGSRCTVPIIARADSNRSIAIRHDQYFGGGTGGSAAWTGVPQTINLTPKWQRFDIVLDDWPSVVGKSIGSSDTDTDRIGIAMFLDAGSNWNSQTNNLGQQSGWFEFMRGEARHDPHGAIPFMENPWSDYSSEAELARCQTLLEVFSHKEIIWNGYVETGQYRWLGVPFKATKRRLPAVSVSKTGSLGFIGSVVCADKSLTGMQIAAVGTATLNSGYYQADVIVDANHPYTP